MASLLTLGSGPVLGEESEPPIPEDDCYVVWILEDGQDAGTDIPPDTRMYWEGDFLGDPDCWRIQVVDEDGNVVMEPTFDLGDGFDYYLFDSTQGDTTPDHVQPSIEDAGLWTVALQLYMGCLCPCWDCWATVDFDQVNVVPVLPVASLTVPLVCTGLLFLRARRE